MHTHIETPQLTVFFPSDKCLHMPTLIVCMGNLKMPWAVFTGAAQENHG